MTLSRWVFLRLLGGAYLIACVSLWSQLEGLVGADGILPAAELLQAAREQLGVERYWELPTLCWLGASDAFLHGLCAAGTLLSLLLLLDCAPALVLFGLWAVYLSLASVCREFLSYQWDTLLLEAGFLAIFLAPLRLRPRLAGKGDGPPSAAALWLLRWLLFRLMFSSGLVKLTSGDPVWRNLTALTYHYETQPLPTWLGWYAHQLPAWAQQGSCGLMFAVELAVPALIIAPGRWRTTGALVLIAFQLLIAATGNYGFFNLLTVALCVLLLDDAAWPARWRARLAQARPAAERARRWPAWLLAPLAAVIVLVSAVQLGGAFRARLPWPAPVLALARGVAPFRTINGYGLFAVMTTTRHEIVVEGSRDGVDWQAYAFTDKPGDPARRPRVVAPHQPRLDWQMWFAALGSVQQNPWFIRFCGRLLAGSPEVLALLAANPFPDQPPRYIRATVYEYHFTDVGTRRAEGTWWRRRWKGLYCPILSLQR